MRAKSFSVTRPKFPSRAGNLSGLPPWLSDALCRLATGGSFAARQLYTDEDEVLFKAARPILLNGIEDVISRPRLRVVDRVHLDRLPRMADFALWATACETALWPAGTFARAYAANRRAAIETIIEADPVATCVRAMMVDRPIWTGSASDLLRLCAQSAGDDMSRGTAWAKNPRALASRLRRAQTFLPTLGIEIAFSREGRAGTRMIRVSRGFETTVSNVSTVGAAPHDMLRSNEDLLAAAGE